MSLYLGLDASTQSLSAVVLDLEARQVVGDLSLNFDERLPQFGTRNGVLPSDEPGVAHSDPLLWLAALDLMCQDLAQAGIDLAQVAAVCGSGQQHGSVYLKAGAEEALGSLDAQRDLAAQLEPALSRATAPIWMDTSTRQQCAEIEDAVGGPQVVADLTGSRCFERFTGPQIRKFWQAEPQSYEQTHRIHLVSSFMASVLAGRHAPIDHGDGAGMNLMDIRRKQWSAPMLEATAPALRAKLPPLAPSDTVVGPLSPYFVGRYGFGPQTRCIAWSGDNPNSLVGVGLIRPGRVCISLGTSDTYFGFMPQPHISTEGEGHVFGSPTGDYMSLICFLNGSLSREKVREAYGLSWEQFSELLRRSAPGNGGKVMLPYFAPEIVPNVAEPGVRRYGLDEDDAEGNVRAVVEAQMASMAIHSEWMGVETRVIHATGGASANRQILETMANVHDAEVHQFQVGNSAALGAALRAAHADRKASGHEMPWEDVVAGFTDPVADSRVRPDEEAVAVYREFKKLYRACEAHALRGGPDPTEARQQFLAETGQA
ncbi:MAG: xylulokinase [Candidatus Brocadiia bacterium]